MNERENWNGFGTALERIEWKLDQVLAALAVGKGDGSVKASGDERFGAGDAREWREKLRVLGGFTTKQHAALQMVIGGASNREIAERFGVTENTAKVYVRSIAAKLGVNSRAQIVASMVGVLESVSEDQYVVLSGGLPKGWHEGWSEDDVFAPLYRKDAEALDVSEASEASVSEEEDGDYEADPC